MNTIKARIILLLVPFLIFGCASTKSARKPPPSKFRGITLAKGIEVKSTQGIPIDPTSAFATQDKEIIAHLKFENLSGMNILRWEWYNPNRDLYYSTGNYPVEISRDKYVKEATAWHRLSIQGDKAAGYPGEWEVKVYLNDELMGSRNFLLNAAIDIEEFPENVKSQETKDWGLVIGIEDYASLPTVDFAKRDAYIVREYFVKVMGVPEENIVTLTDSNATRARIEGFLKDYFPANIEKGANLYVYYAGHGAPDMDKGEPYLVPYDGDTRFIEKTGYRLKNFYADLDKLKVKTVFVFLDSCFSGVASRATEMLTEGARPALIHVEDVTVKSEDLISLTGSEAGQISNAYPETQHGLFTYFLLKGLRGEADANADSLVSVKEVYNYVKDNVVKISRRMGKEQTPFISPSLDIIKDQTISRSMK